MQEIEYSLGHTRQDIMYLRHYKYCPGDTKKSTQKHLERGSMVASAPLVRYITSKSNFYADIPNFRLVPRGSLDQNMKKT